jgi:hypothetical protein
VILPQTVHAAEVKWRGGDGARGITLRRGSASAGCGPPRSSGATGYGLTGGADPPSVGAERRFRSHKTSPVTSTAAARMPNAIQPHCVLFVSSFSLDAAAAPAAAAAAGLTPEVVVAAEVVAGGAAATVAVCV